MSMMFGAHVLHKKLYVRVCMETIEDVFGAWAFS